MVNQHRDRESLDSAPAVRLAAPWYLHPAVAPDAWWRLLAGSELAFAVINPANGPSVGDPYYSPLLATGSHTPLLGYVDVGYGSRPRADILDDVTAWLDSAPVVGIMLDCVPPGPSQGLWDLGLIARVRALGAHLVVANPGMPPDPRLVWEADLTCVAEFDWATLRSWRPPAWIADMDAGRLWMLVHDVPAREQSEALRRVAELGAGYGWVTSGTIPDPWSVLPERW